MSDSEYFEVIDSHSTYEFIGESIRQDPKAPLNPYRVSIRPSKTQLDHALLESQYYQFEVFFMEKPVKTVQRRYSDFALLFQILRRREPGFIFPAFPENGLFAFVKSKVTLAKDQAFIETRTKVIERFFSRLFNHPEYSPDSCKQVQEFLSQGRQFQARRQIEKGGGTGVWGRSLTLLKNYFTFSRENKYAEEEQRIAKLKTMFEELYMRAHELGILLAEEKEENAKLRQQQGMKQYLNFFFNLIKTHDQQQEKNIKDLLTAQFDLFCQSEDLTMAQRIIQRMNDLRKDEDNYSQLRQTQEKFNSMIDKFLAEKVKSAEEQQERLQETIESLKKVSRFTS